MTTRGLSRRTFLRTMLGTAGAGILAACGATPTTTPSTSDPAPQATSPATTDDSPAVAPTTAGSPIEAEGILWGLQYDPHVEAYNRLVALFKEQTGSNLKVEPQAGDLVPKFITASAAGTQPDVYCLIGNALVPLFIQKLLMPLSEMVFKTKGIDPNTAFIGDSVQAYAWENEIWGVPVESNAVGNTVNVLVDEVKEMGLADQFPPTNGKTYFESYDEMWALAKQMQKEENGNVTRWGISSKGWDAPELLGIIRSQGVKWWDQDAKKFNIDSEAGVTAMKLLVETPVKMGIETELDQGVVDAALAGKIALAVGNPTPATTGMELGYHFEVAGVPRVKPGEDPLFIGEGGWGFIGPKQTRNPGITTAFLQMMATKEAQLEYAKIYNGLPFFAWAELADDTTRFSDNSPESPNVKAAKLFATLLPNTEYMGEGFGYKGEVYKATAEVCSDVRQGKLTAEAGAKELQSRFEAQYTQFVEDLARGAG